MSKIIKFAACLLLLAMLPIALFACNSQVPEPTESANESEEATQKPTATEEVIVGTPIDILGNEDKIKIIPRLSNTSRRCPRHPELIGGSKNEYKQEAFDAN